MKNHRITYGELDGVLERLGFHPVPTSGPQKVFENQAFDALVVLPPEEMDQSVRPHHWVAIRKLVIEKGIVDSTALERLIEDQSPAGVS